jgi:hypothetical protein
VLLAKVAIRGHALQRRGLPADNEIDRLCELLKANNRNPEDFEFSMLPVASTSTDLHRYRDAGVDDSI